MKNSRTLGDRSRGSASVEAIIVIPIYIMLLAGVVMVGHKELNRAQNAVAARYSLWMGQGGSKTSESAVGKATFQTGGRGESASGENGQVLDWNGIYGPMEVKQPLLKDEFMQLMAAENKGGKDEEGAALRGYLTFQTSESTVQTSSIIPFSGLFSGKSDGSSKVQATIQNKQFVVVPKGQPGKTIRKFAVDKAGTRAEAPIERTLGSIFGPARETN